MTQQLDHTQGTFQKQPRPLFANKISSSAALQVARNEISVAENQAPKPGDIIAVRVSNDSEVANLLELGNGRMASVNHRDIIVGALGKRRALKGFVGYVPETLNLGDKLSILNLGGVLGKVTGGLQGLHAAIEVEYLGSVVNDSGQFANISDNAIPLECEFEGRVPIVLVAGTCMQAGKTKAAGELIKRFSREGYQVAGAKLTGIACLRDTLFMEDYGATKTLDFQSCGFPSTIDLDSVSPIAKAIFQRLSVDEPDVIVVELGDGIMGYYNVESLFADSEILDATAATVLCANDFVGAWGGIEFLKQKNVQVDLVSGPATDSGMAVDYIESKFEVDAANAFNDREKFYQTIKSRVELWKRQKNLN